MQGASASPSSGQEPFHTTTSHDAPGPSSNSHSQRKPWHSTGRSQQSQQQHQYHDGGTPSHGNLHDPGAASSSAPKAKWWKVHLFRGMLKDIKRRAPYYWSDWLDAWDYRVVPATVYMYFAKYVYPYLSSFYYLHMYFLLHSLSNMTMQYSTCSGILAGHV